MRDWAVPGLAVVALGVVLASAPIVFIGAAILVVRVLAEVWPRHVLASLAYERSVTPRKTVVGDEVSLRMSLWNRSRLPIPFTISEDTLPEGLRVRVKGERRPYAPPGRESPAFLDDPTAAVQISGPLRPFERLTRRSTIVPVRRGVHEIGPVHLRVAELFGSHSPQRDPGTEYTTVVARPMTAPVLGTSPATAPIARARVQRSLFTDPTLFAGVRPFQAGDPLRSVHWRASARERALQAKRYEPALSRQLVIVLDVQTVEGPYWLLEYDEDVFEALCVAALSLTRSLVASDTACGLAAAGFSGAPQRYVFVPPRADRSQVDRVGDVLARLTTESAAPLPILLGWLPRRVAVGTMLVVLTGRDPLPNLALVRRLWRSGFPVHFFMLGGDERMRAARDAGLAAWQISIEGTPAAPEMVVVHA